MSRAIKPQQPPGGRTTFGEPTARPDTLADRRAFLSEGLHPLRCQSCAVEVLVKKHSVKHTSIQWTSDAHECPVFAALGRSSARADTCARLAESIRAAVQDGSLPIGEL